MIVESRRFGCRLSAGRGVLPTQVWLTKVESRRFGCRLSAGRGVLPTQVWLTKVESRRFGCPLSAVLCRSLRKSP